MCPKNDEERRYMKNIPYLEAVGSIMYLATTTCPDIAYAAGTLARFGSNPGLEHWTTVKHLLRYLRGTANHVITYSPDYTTNETFTTLSDADHGGCKDSGRLTGGYILKIGTGAVSWSSKLQDCRTIIHRSRIFRPRRSWKGNLLDVKLIIGNRLQK